MFGSAVSISFWTTLVWICCWIVGLDVFVVWGIAREKWSHGLEVFWLEGFFLDSGSRFRCYYCMGWVYGVEILFAEKTQLPRNITREVRWVLSRNYCVQLFYTKALSPFLRIAWRETKKYKTGPLSLAYTAWTSYRWLRAWRTTISVTKRYFNTT